MDPLFDTLVRRLQAVAPLDEARATQIATEVLDAFDLTADAFIVARHAELQRQGLSNEAIYDRICDELARWRFRGPELTARQVRRRIYGG